eukprot:Opistho-2@45391
MLRLCIQPCGRSAKAWSPSIDTHSNLLGKHDAGLIKDARDLTDGIVEGRCAVVALLLHGSDAGLHARVHHRVLEPRIHNVLLVGAVDDQATLGVAELAAALLLNDLHELGLAVLLPLLVEASETDVREVLEPLKVRHGDTSGVEEEIRNDNNALLHENVVASWGAGSVSSLADDLRLNVVCIAFVDLTLKGGRNEHIALSLENVERVLGVLGLGVALPRLVSAEVCVRILNINAVLVEDAAVVFSNGDHLATSALQEHSGVVADVTKSLDGVTLALDARRQTRLLLHLLIRQKLADAIVHTESRSLRATAHTALGEGLAGDARHAIDVTVVELLVRILDPSHLPAAGAHVGGGHIDTGSNKVLLAQFHSEATSNALQLVLRVLGGVDADASLCATKGHIDDSALVCHECGKRLDLLKIDLLRVADASLDGKTMTAVLSTVAVDKLKVSVGFLEGKAHAQNSVAALHVQEVAGLDLRVEVSGALEKELSTLEEIGLGVLDCLVLFCLGCVRTCAEGKGGPDLASNQCGAHNSTHGKHFCRVNITAERTTPMYSALI